MTETPPKTLVTEENYGKIQFSTPWQFGAGTVEGRDSDGFPLTSPISSGLSDFTLSQLRAHIWHKFHSNPHVNTSMRGLAGRIAGTGFATVSDEKLINEVVEKIETDYRNRLYDYWPKLITRAYLSGELHLCFTCHKDGFIEVDYIDPDFIEGEADHGIIFHPRKTRMPLVYCVKDENNDIEEQIPSIYLARYPELIKEARKNDAFRSTYMNNSRSRAKAFKELGGFNRFIVSWDLGLITHRSSPHLQTILQWLNHWENLKKYEIDHKKSSGAYVWVVNFSDVQSWVTWLNLSDEERRKTGIASPKTPGGTLVLGPNMEVKASNPTLPKISEGDSDIMQMISSGLNEPEDVTTGQAKGTFASVKASRGPMSDKTSDEMAYFERWYRYDFWGNIFFLMSKTVGFPEFFVKREATSFENKKPVMEDVKKKPEKCIDILFPISAIENIEGEAKGMLGVKHGSLNDTAGIPNEMLMGRMGIRNYRQARLQKATEDEIYPKLILAVDQEAHQEKKEGE